MAAPTVIWALCSKSDGDLSVAHMAVPSLSACLSLSLSLSARVGVLPKCVIQSLLVQFALSVLLLLLLLLLAHILGIDCV